MPRATIDRLIINSPYKEPANINASRSRSWMTAGLRV